MENKRNILNKFILLVAFFIPIPIYGEIPIPTSVEAFYKNIKKLNGAKNENESSDICNSMRECFYGMDQSSSGGNLPNDFRFFEYDKKSISHNHGTLNVSNYIDKLENYIYKEGVMKVDYRILKSEANGEQPDFNKGRLSVMTSLISTCVEKTYVLNGVQKVFNDTVITDYASGKISEINNGYGQPIVNVTTLRNKAAVAYRLKRYYEAFRYYEQIISIVPNDADVLYRIGLMVYFQYDDCRVQKKNRKSKAKNYLALAQIYGRHSGIDEKAKNVLHWINYSNV